MKDLPVETKDVITDIINEFVKAVDMSIASGVVQRVLKEAYDKGLDEIGLQLGMNFMGDPKRLEFLQSYTFENIKDMNDEMAGKLRKEISQSLLNLEGVEMMKKRVQSVMDVTVNRARMIARTEAVRAANMGHLDGARESGLNMVKEWSAHIDARTSPICKALNGKQVPINSQFTYKGEKFDAPPAHPFCRSTLLFIQKD